MDYQIYCPVENRMTTHEATIVTSEWVLGTEGDTCVTCMECRREQFYGSHQDSLNAIEVLTNEDGTPYEPSHERQPHSPEILAARASRSHERPVRPEKNLGRLMFDAAKAYYEA